MAYLEDIDHKIKDGEEHFDVVQDKRDEEILALSIENPRHFEILILRYQDAFLRNARKVLGPREEAIDVVQETFTKIYVNAKKFREVEGAKFSSWAYKILFNTAFTHYKKTKKKEGFFAQIDDEVWNILPDLSIESLEERGMRDFVASIISRMPEPLAKVLTLHYIEDKPQKEIAEMESSSLPAIKTRIHRAKRIFKELSESKLFV